MWIRIQVGLIFKLRGQPGMLQETVPEAVLPVLYKTGSDV